jgi:MFS superfamily sulfate permease-like transporter
VLGLATIITVLLWQRFVHRRLPYIHGALVAVTLATLVAYLWHAPVKYVAIPKDLRACFDILQSSDLGATPLITVLGNGLMVAFIASAETLLTAAALDKLYPRSKTDFDRELFAQGVGNMCAGFIGVLPVTGVMARSGTNAAAGAQSRMSAVLHGAWLLLFVVTFPWLLKLVPTASLAALLVYIGLKMANLGVWKEISKYGKSEVATYFATLGLIVCTDLLTGVLAGIALAISSLIYRFTHLDVVVNKDSENNRTDITLHGAATFLRLPNLARVLDDVEPGTELHVHLDRLNYIDHACLDLLLSWDKQHQASGGRLVIDWNALDSMYQDRRTSVRDDGIRQFRRVEPAVQVCETEVR